MSDKKEIEPINKELENALAMIKEVCANFMSKTVVLFEKGKNPRIFKNPESLSELQKRGPILVNPLMPKGVPPHEWRLVNGKIKTGGVAVKEPKPLPPQKVGKSIGWFMPLALILLGILVSIHVYEEREMISKIPSEIKTLFSK